MDLSPFLHPWENGRGSGETRIPGLEEEPDTGFLGAFFTAWGETFSDGRAFDSADGAAYQILNTTLGWAIDYEKPKPRFNHHREFAQGEVIGYYAGQTENAALMVYGAYGAARGLVAMRGALQATPTLVTAEGFVIAGTVEAEAAIATTALHGFYFAEGSFAFGDAPNRGVGAGHNAANAVKLNRHLSQLEKYGKGGFKQLENGRYRYFGELSKATKPGEMVGRRVVREWDPATGATRTWMETLDAAGRVRIVRPETGGAKIHYMFDELGNFIGTF